MKWYFTLWIILLSLLTLEAQPTLTGNITFEELLKRKSSRVLTWSNPDATRDSLTITLLPIPINEKIVRLTTDFANSNYGISTPWLNPKMIVLHSMDFGSLKEALEKSSFLHDRMPESWGVLSKAGALPNGAHFFIDREGEIYCLTPPLSRNSISESWSDDHHWLIRRHQDGNPLAIGIENITLPDGRFDDLTESQIMANAKLIQWLIGFEKSKIQFLFSHHQFNDTTFHNTLMQKFKLNYHQKKYRTTDRQDIGSEGLKKIKELVNQTGWKIKSEIE